MNAKHMPTPWMVSKVSDGSCSIHCAIDAPNPIAHDLSFINADYIVQCVNMHDELVECLRRLRMHCTDKYDAKQIDDLLLKAKGE